MDNYFYNIALRRLKKQYHFTAREIAAFSGYPVRTVESWLSMQHALCSSKFELFVIKLGNYLEERNTT